MIALRLLPYPDPLARRHMRKAARRLASGSPWPGEQAEPLDIARLALSRTLWLQRQTRRAARWRQSEAALLLARASLETCLVGLYWLCEEAQAEQMRGDNARTFRQMFKTMADGEILTEELIEGLSAAIGEPSRLPTLRDMAKRVGAEREQRFPVEMYERFYVPLSILVPHASAQALLRHVDDDGALAEVPEKIWTIRSARHSADACAALLAFAIAERLGSPTDELADYADAHMERTTPPMGTIALRGTLHGLRPAKVLRSLPPLFELRRYYRSEQLGLDSEPQRRQRTRQGIDDVLQALGCEPSAALETLVEHFTGLLVDSLDGSPVAPDR